MPFVNKKQETKKINSQTLKYVALMVGYDLKFETKQEVELWFNK